MRPPNKPTDCQADSTGTDNDLAWIYRGIVEHMDDAVYVRGPGRQILYTNPAAERLTGVAWQEARQTPCFQIFGDKELKCHTNCPVDQTVAEQSPVHHHEGTVKNMDGQTTDVAVSISPILQDGQVVASIVQLSDRARYQELERTHLRTTMELERVQQMLEVNEQKLREANQQLTDLAMHDQLTGLPNRRCFSENLTRFIQRAKRRRESFAAMLVDLDGFKAVNDSMGHAAGDSLLAKVGARIKSKLRQTDVIARVGSDEFGLLIENVSNSDQVTVIADKLLQTISTPVSVNGQTASISGSIGIAFYGPDGVTSDSLIRSAGDAMFAAKRNGKNQSAFASLKAA